jgi:hypothetical protein
VSFCPTCRTEYVAGVTHCADCGRLLAQRLPDRRPVGEPVTEVTVQTFANWLEASVWAERLRSEGIPVVVMPAGAGSQPGTEQLWPHALRVRSTDVARAREILQPD